MHDDGCTLGPEGLPARMAEWSALIGGSLRAREVIDEGCVLHFNADEGVADELRRLAALEGECCASLTFRVRDREEAVILEVTGPWKETPWRMAMPLETTS